MPDGVEVLRPVDDRQAAVLSREALAFLADLQRRFGPARDRLLAARQERWQRLRAGQRPDFLPETAEVRAGDWRVAPAPPALARRRVEITGPTEAKMLINAFNSGADVFMVDFEDANAPTWSNLVGGQANLSEAIDGTLRFRSPEGKEYRLKDERAVPVVRPRGWHLVERNVLVDGQPISASLFDFGLCFFHNARRLLDRGLGPYFYLPKLEGHLEARLWNDVFNAAQDAIGLDRGTIRCTVLIETILAAFEMEEILYELADHGCALNAGRWDYIFSVIKKFCDDPDLVLPDRGQITMTVPFMS
ncbi:MAG TPA: malate synthase A, partial [Acidimicrobiia bacterium]|nr:malate synthase A [Acidimicrobiia bacterium]